MKYKKTNKEYINDMYLSISDIITRKQFKKELAILWSFYEVAKKYKLIN